MKKQILALGAGLLAVLPAAAAGIDIVGSSTVYPFSAVVAELFAEASAHKAPKVESTGSGGGMKLFCAGLDDGTPDITNASRRMKKSEQVLCAKNGVTEIQEVKIGYDGIVIAQSAAAEPFALTQRQLFLALGRQVPDSAGKLIDNPHKTWRDIDASLPALAIRVYGPPPTSGTRDAFAELVLEKGCASFPQLKEMREKNKKIYRAVCHSIREDGGYIEAGENDNLIIRKLSANPDTLGIFGFGFLEENRDQVRGLAVEGVLPEFDAIAAGDYPVSRPLFFYAKIAHYSAVAGLADFVEFFVSEEVMGEDGILAERGLIPLPAAEYAHVVGAVKQRAGMAQL